jgi:hypothetical protein
MTRKRAESPTDEYNKMLREGDGNETTNKA